ncbi:MAG TPA: tetratricopeptide repeat protein [Candidatus Methylomirabilis sp.]|nr:tetratricopeptide repeat protein [Candidatus Methylomirabilis sp.]
MDGKRSNGYYVWGRRENPDRPPTVRRVTMLIHTKIRRYAKSPLGIILSVAFAVFAFGFFFGGVIGKWLVNIGRPSEGIAVYRLALSVYPWNTAGHNDLGLILMRHGDPQGAIDALRKAVELEPDVARLHHHLGFAYFENGDIDEAVQEFQEAVRLDPEHEDYRSDLEMAIVVRGEAKGPASPTPPR